MATVLTLAACAAVEHSPVRLQPLALSGQPAPRVLAQETRITLDTGYTRTLKAGGRWRAAGTVDQGDVYRPVGDVFTLEGAHIHEAWLVVRDGVLVGFYLPAEHGYSPLGATAPLQLTHP
ncbi:MAG: hypothetical protein ACJ8HJ_07930 [Massilia sp.]